LRGFPMKSLTRESIWIGEIAIPIHPPSWNEIE